MKSGDTPIDVDRVMAIAGKKLAAYDDATPEKIHYPNDSKNDKWTVTPSSKWTSGFYPGALWHMYEYSTRRNKPDADAWRKRAEAWTAGIENEKFNTNTHDLGFIVFDSFGNGERLTGRDDYKEVIKRGAQSLAKRFNEKTGMIRSWGKIEDEADFQTIIDNMMNLELLVWAARNGGTTEGGTSEDLLKIATTHADNTITHFFRPDGGTYHVVHSDPKTGAIVRKRTHQGKDTETSWSRGQTWALYGFTDMYEFTKEKRYLDAAVKAANYYIAHLPADHVPPSDFQSDLEGLEFKDSSAAAIAASALIKLSGFVEDPALKEKYWTTAVNTLRSLTAAPYLAEGPDKASILLYQARNYNPDPNSNLTNTSLIFGDYYLLEALLRYDAKLTKT
jgi:unsaturated chondroitin disaccharide hydrolase